MVFISKRKMEARKGTMEAPLIFLCAILVVSSGQIVTQSNLDIMASHLGIQWDVVTNTKDVMTYQAELTLDNQAPNVSLDNLHWQIRFFSIFMIEPDLLGVQGHKTIELPGQGVKVTHIQGSLFALEPTEDFVTLHPKGSKRKIKFKVKFWSVARTDSMGNWYLLATGLQPKVIKSTTGEELTFVTGMSRVEQWKRYNYDEYHPYTVQERYDRYEVPNPSDDTEVRLIPKPVKIRVNDRSRTVILNSNWKISHGANLRPEAIHLMEQLGLNEQAVSSRPLNGRRVIELTQGNVDLEDSHRYIKDSPDAYSLVVSVDDERVTITGSGASGVIGGISSLLSLMDAKKHVPECEVMDAPRFEYRGLMVDIARNFHDRDTILHLLPTMARYKLNRLHLHLSDDEAWRLQIAALPELTEIGSRRCHDDAEERCLLPQLGSGPDSSLSFASGYLSSQDYQDILRKAQQLHIQVIPEFDMPGHARAAVVAMKHRNKVLADEQKAEEGRRYLLVDENDPSVYITAQMFNDNAMNPCLPSVFNFVDTVLNELIQLHQTIQPLTVFHFGGDEVGVGAWVNSTTCNAMSDQLPDGSPKAYFFQQISQMALSKNVSLGAWEDGVMEEDNTPFTLSKKDSATMYAYSWDNVWEWNTTARAYTLANDGYKVVLAHGSHLYFDHPYEPDPEERGYYWATRFADTKKTFSYNAQDAYANSNNRRSGQVVTEEEKCGENEERCPVLTKPENIIGMEGVLFSETTRTKEQLDDRLFPRILAMAERAWHYAPWENISDSQERKDMMMEDWYSFVRAVGHRELSKLEAAGIEYRIPPPGAKIFRNYLLSTALYPGLTVEYNLGTGKAWHEASSRVNLADHKNRVWLRTRSLGGERYSRVVVLNQEPYIPPTIQSVIDYIGNKISLTFTLVDNFQSYGDASYKATITLTNNGNITVPLGNWAIYFVSVQWIEPELLKVGKRFIDLNSQMYIEHVKGYLFKFGPTGDFKGLPGQEKLSITFKGQSWSASRYDQMPNWYVAARGTTAHNMKNTEDESLAFVSNFDTADKWKRMENDAYDPWTPASRYDRNQNLLVATNNRPGVLPTPMHYTPDAGAVNLTSGSWHILYDVDNGQNIPTQSVAAYIKETLTIFLPAIQLQLTPSTTNIDDSPVIRLKFGDVKSSNDSKEAYEMKVDSVNNTIDITAPTKAGIFYGAVSLIQLALPDGQVPAGQMEDRPRFPYRGMHVDTARNFQHKEVIIKLLDVMGLYKLNKLHLHLTDDEGWRLEIPGLPELTALGARRCHDLEEQECILSTLGSGADSQSNGNGFYTVDDYKEILNHANQRNIEVIPEFDFPGHAHTAIKAMRMRRQRLIDLGYTAKADHFLLDDPDDPSHYFSIQFYDDNAANPCRESTYKFLEHVLTQVKDMHASIQPLKTFHYGGDEVARGAWKKSRSCIQLLKSKVNLKEYFTKRVSELTADLTLGSWEDGLMDHGNIPWNRTILKNDKVIAHAWQNVWEWGAGRRAHALANAGYQVILSPVTHAYFDHPSEPSPEERGFYWGTRYTDAYKTLSFLPDDYYGNIDVRVSGNPITKEEVCGKDNAGCPALEKPENIIGIQGQLWSETVRDSSQFDNMVYPRLLALAEKAWHKGSWETKTGQDHKSGRDAQFSKFAHMLGSKHLAVMDKLGVAYRVPPPGARQSREKILANVEFPGLTIEYRVQGKQTWIPLTSNTGFTTPTTVHLRSASADGKRFSRQISVNMKRVITKPNGSTVSSLSTVLCVIVAIVVHSISTVYL